MKVAVVIPSYNHEKYISLAIDSALVQSYKVNEVIVIDDGSTDNSINLLKSKYGNNSKVHITEQKNEGAHNAINKGILIAKERNNNVIAILNSDDIYEKDRISNCIKYLNDDIKVVCSGINLIDENNETILEKSPRSDWFEAVWKIKNTDNISLPQALGIANFIATTSNIIADANYLYNNPFQPYRYCHDYYFLINAALRNNLIVIDEPLVNYRIHINNTMNTPKYKLVTEMLKLNLDIRKDIISELDNKEIRNNYLEYLHATWENVSSFNNGYLNIFLSELIKDYDNAKLQNLFKNFTEKYHNELDNYPNTSKLKYIDDNFGMIQKFDTFNQKNKALQKDKIKFKEIKSLLKQSFWIKLGAKFGSKNSKKLLNLK